MNLSKLNRLKLAKMIMKFGEIQTDKGLINYEGELVVGCEVFIESEGELIPAGDGEYISDNTIYVVEGGIIKEIKQKDVEPIETPANEPEQEKEKETEMENETESEKEQETETNDEVETLKKENEELKQKIDELEKIIAEYKEKESKSEGESIEKVEQNFRDENKPKQGLKFFENMISKH